jgi:RecA-family ATPase
MSGPRDPFDPEDLADLLTEEIEPRQWLLGKLLCRKYLTVSAASGGTGKTSLAITLALSLATGRPLLGIHVHKQCRVLLLTYEDGREEYKRRFKAACLHYNIHADDIGGRILIKSLAGAEGTKTLAEVSERGGMRETGTAEQIAEIIRREEADVVMIDPFIKCSGGARER